MNDPAPCVVLIDEVEKVFQSGEDGGVTSRILSQLLWWLAEHRTRVLTVMTTNDYAAIPPELYRPGRLDKVMFLPKLPLGLARHFPVAVFKSMLGQDIAPAQYSLDAALSANEEDSL